MNNKKLSLSGLMLYIIFLTTSLRVVANNQVQIVNSSNNYYSAGIFLILGALIIGFIGILLGGVIVPGDGNPGDPRDPYTPGEEGPSFW